MKNTIQHFEARLANVGAWRDEISAQIAALEEQTFDLPKGKQVNKINSLIFRLRRKADEMAVDYEQRSAHRLRYLKKLLNDIKNHCPTPAERLSTHDLHCRVLLAIKSIESRTVAKSVGNTLSLTPPLTRGIRYNNTPIG
jgi:hypothetical protein